jgi:hypothetical protein
MTLSHRGFVHLLAAFRQVGGTACMTGICFGGICSHREYGRQQGCDKGCVAGVANWSNHGFRLFRSEFLSRTLYAQLDRVNMPFGKSLTAWCHYLFVAQTFTKSGQPAKRRFAKLNLMQ